MDIFILLFFYYLFGVDVMRVITKATEKEIVFTCIVYATTVYHQIESKVSDFVCPKYYCDLGRGIPTWFQVLDQMVMHIFSALGKVIHPFVLYKYV